MNRKEEYNLLVSAIRLSKKADGKPWTMQDIANKIDYTRGHIYRFLRGETDVDENDVIILKERFKDVLQNGTISKNQPEQIKPELQINNNSMEDYKDKYIKLLESNLEEYRKEFAEYRNLLKHLKGMVVSEGALLESLYENLVKDSAKDRSLIEKFQKSIQTDNEVSSGK